jgi:hypothetical protein
VPRRIPHRGTRLSASGGSQPISEQPLIWRSAQKAVTAGVRSESVPEVPSAPRGEVWRRLRAARAVRARLAGSRRNGGQGPSQNATAPAQLCAGLRAGAPRPAQRVHERAQGERRTSREPRRVLKVSVGPLENLDGLLEAPHPAPPPSSIPIVLNAIPVGVASFSRCASSSSARTRRSARARSSPAIARASAERQHDQLGLNSLASTAGEAWRRSSTTDGCPNRFREQLIRAQKASAPGHGRRCGAARRPRPRTRTG